MGGWSGWIILGGSHGAHLGAVVVLLAAAVAGGGMAGLVELLLEAIHDCDLTELQASQEMAA